MSFAPDRPGIYELAYEGGSARFAINLDPREPDLRPLDTKLLLTKVQSGPAPPGGPGPAAAPMLAGPAAKERIEGRQRIWRYLLLAVLAMLAGEMLLAARIGRA